MLCRWHVVSSEAGASSVHCSDLMCVSSIGIQLVYGSINGPTLKRKVPEQFRYVDCILLQRCRLRGKLGWR